MFCRNSSGTVPLVAQLDEMRALERGFGEQHAVVGDDADRVAVDVGEPVTRVVPYSALNSPNSTAVDEAGDDVVHVVGNSRVDGNHVVELGLIGNRLDRWRHIPDARFTRTQCRHDAPDDAQCVASSSAQMVGDTGDLGVQVSAAEILRRDDFPGGGLHQRRAAEEDRALVANDHRLVAHRRDVRAAGCARSQHGRDLRNALGAQCGLVVEDPAEVIAVGEHLVLPGQEGAAGVDQVDARQPVLPAISWARKCFLTVIG